MSKQWMKSALAAGVLVASTVGAANAEEEQGFYVGGNAVYTDVFDADTTITTETDAGGNPLSNLPLIGDLLDLLGGGGAGTQIESGDIEYDRDFGYGISAGYNFSNPFRLELEYRKGENDAKNFGASLEVESLMTNLWYDFRAGERLRPYVGGGLGMATIDLDGADDDVMIGQLGAGVNYNLTPRLVLDAGYRYAMAEDPKFVEGNTKIETEYESQSLLLGLRYNFFDAKYGVQDADGDGVADEADQCPGTPRGVQVDSVGCPLDGDKDGVADYLDKCPNTPAGEEVDAQGCSLDGDGDGVVDADDMCPDTPAGTEVMSNGCGGEQSVVLRGVNFELNSAQLTVNAETILDGVAATLSSSPGFNVELQGHTDSMGSDSYNMNLSQNRAKSVKNYLVNQGVESGRLTARGYGEEQPIASNDTAEGRAENRRVELKVLGEQDVMVDEVYMPATEEPMEEESSVVDAQVEDYEPAADLEEEESVEESYEYDYDPAAEIEEEEYEYDYEYEP